MYTPDDGVVGSGMGLFLIVAHNSKNQLNVCTVYGVLFSPQAEICARLESNFCQKLTTIKSGANDMDWLNVCV
jgi:hypothetical protein